MLRLQSIVHRLFFSYGILVINIIIISGLALYFLKRSNDANEVGERLQNQRLRMIELINTDLDFLRFETVNTNYFKDHTSAVLDTRTRLLKEIMHEQSFLKTSGDVRAFLPDFNLSPIDQSLTEYDHTFQQLRNRIDIKGFKDFGVEGAMREFAHELEVKNAIPLAILLTLRRHEKDFLLRKEDLYIDRFNSLADSLIVYFQKHQESAIASTLSAYQREFTHLTHLTYEIGITPQTGLLGELNQHTARIHEQLAELNNLVFESQGNILLHGAIFLQPFLLPLFSRRVC